ncbi:MAG: class I SAM-dependent methyltransferase [Microthrixaceae bacterium]
MENRCPACASTSLCEVATVRDVPVHVGVLWRSAAEARACATGTLAVASCGRCGLLTNTEFDPNLLDYGFDYDNSLHASAVFRDFESSLVSELVERHDLHDKYIVEIGGGDGRFIGLLCEQGGNRGICFDPSADPWCSPHPDVELVAEPFGPDSLPADVDFICCRQVLEHIADLHAFLEPVTAVLRARPGASAYLEVPESTMMLRDLSIWDLVYEHCHYFVKESFSSLLESADLEVLTTRTGFGDQFLSAEVSAAAEPQGVPRTSVEPLPIELRRMIGSLGANIETGRDEWVRRLGELRSEGRKVAVWGAGARAVTFCAMVGGAGEVDYFVDANPAKQGTYLAGSGHPIHPPDHLVYEPVDVVVILNNIYEDEIRAGLTTMNVEAELVAG